eukprot:GHVL01001328.1.p1 GENE.GHVL01001328.1~~GHVL01001328.1.p1  ORF type:complete len:156 (-),score=43.19 GHVL01001328.1:1062-1529(-)
MLYFYIFFVLVSTNPLRDRNYRNSHKNLLINEADDLIINIENNDRQNDVFVSFMKPFRGIKPTGNVVLSDFSDDEDNNFEGLGSLGFDEEEEDNNYVGSDSNSDSEEERLSGSNSEIDSEEEEEEESESDEYGSDEYGESDDELFDPKKGPQSLD